MIAYLKACKKTVLHFCNIILPPIKMVAKNVNKLEELWKAICQFENFHLEKSKD